MYHIEINVQQSHWPVDADRLRAIVEAVLEEEGIAAATIQVAIVDDPAIHKLNRQFLDHDYPTDVLSFLMSEGPELEGDVIASAQTAARAAESYGWTTADELLLYVLHGTLHLVGYDDLDPDSQARMRQRERYYLNSLGLVLRHDALEYSVLAHSEPRHGELETVAQPAGYASSTVEGRLPREENGP